MSIIFPLIFSNRNKTNSMKTVLYEMDEYGVFFPKIPIWP